LRRIVFFDLDGTLTDSGPGIKASINYALNKMNIAELGWDSDWVVGPSLWGTFKKLGVIEERLDEAVSLYRDRYNVKGYIENSVYEGIPDQLATLKSMGYLLCVATAKPTISAISILEYFKLRQHFSFEFGSNLDGSLSDKSALLKHALEVTSIDPKDSLMIGDREYDILGAKSNLIKSIGVSYGYGSKNELKEAHADFLIETPVELVGAVEQLLPI
jgi:phosphoglycolate phosphatase